MDSNKQEQQMEHTMTRKEELASIYWDFYKEVYSVRPRHINFEACTEAELEGMLDRLNEQAQVVFAEREEAEKNAVAAFENLVSMTIAAGADDRETALRWIMEGSEYNGDWDYFAWGHGLPYGYFRKMA
jgi:hypothetical protein